MLICRCKAAASSGRGLVWRPMEAEQASRRSWTYFLLNRCAGRGSTRTMTEAMADKIVAPVSHYVMNDACRAAQFIRLNAAKWNIDSKRIAAGGGSQCRLAVPLYLGCVGDQANPQSTDPIERLPTTVTCVAAYRSHSRLIPSECKNGCRASNGFPKRWL